MSKPKIDPKFLEKSADEFADAFTNGNYMDELKKGMEKIYEEEDKVKRAEIEKLNR